MNAEDVEIEGLTLERGLPAMIAAMQFANWGRSTGFNSAEEYERFLCDAVHSHRLPAVLVARRGEKFLGSVNLLVHEMTTRPSLSPWLAQLFVLAEERGRGVGSALVRACLARFAELGFSRVHLYTAATTTLPAYYTALGWKAIEEIEYLGKIRAVMAFDFPG
ncbi:MAG TPA: GNAT family N-acetyltransferase [Bradyrhizobium sp.]|jgi:predicted N-acetyltransferase YhbS|nr:GNAT family N-acetyltransferase [Bradyrhizobium sp.]